jgi:hypothetical protein
MSWIWKPVNFPISIRLQENQPHLISLTSWDLRITRRLGSHGNTIHTDIQLPRAIPAVPPPGTAWYRCSRCQSHHGAGHGPGPHPWCSPQRSQWKLIRRSDRLKGGKNGYKWMEKRRRWWFHGNSYEYVYIYICACDMYIMSQLASLDDRSVSTSSFGSGVFNKTLSGCVSTPNPEIDWDCENMRKPHSKLHLDM